MLLVILYVFLPPGDGTFTRITAFFAQLWIYSTATHCPAPVFTTTTTAHTTTSASAKSKQTCTSNPAFQRINPSRNSTQHDSCNWKGDNSHKSTIQKITQHNSVLFYSTSVATCVWLLRHLKTFLDLKSLGEENKKDSWD